MSTVTQLSKAKKAQASILGIIGIAFLILQGTLNVVQSGSTKTSIIITILYDDDIYMSATPTGSFIGYTGLGSANTPTFTYGNVRSNGVFYGNWQGAATTTAAQTVHVTIIVNNPDGIRTIAYQERQQGTVNVIQSGSTTSSTTITMQYNNDLFMSATPTSTFVSYTGLGVAYTPTFTYGEVQTDGGVFYGNWQTGGFTTTTPTSQAGLTATVTSLRTVTSVRYFTDNSNSCCNLKHLQSTKLRDPNRH